MAKFKVVVTDYVFQNLDVERAIFGECDADLVVGQCKCVEDLIMIAQDADVLLNTYLGPLDERVFSILRKCRLIARYGIGTDTIDIESATRYGIMVTNVPDYCLDEVSDHAVACMLALLRKLPIADRHMRQGENNLECLKPLHRINGLTVGIVGMGRIGRLSAHKVSAFGVDVIFTDPNVEEDIIIGDGLTARKVLLRELAALSHAILIHAPANPQTHHMFDSELFRAMEQRPVIVNCARGSLVDTEALVEALAQGWISGAALDVIEGAPHSPLDSRLVQFENVILSPHSAWYSEEALAALQRSAAEEVARVLRGERPKFLVNPEVLSKVSS